MDAPTLEWQRKNSHDKAHTDDKTRRVTYRRISIWEKLRKDGDIDNGQLQAANKLYKIHWGSLGMDVRDGDNINPDPLEYPQSYYAQKLAEAEQAVTVPAIWSAMIQQVQLEDFDLFIDIGRKARGVKDRRIARAHGLCMVQTGLDLLAYHWGFKARQT
jgi:hypothetical protein